MDSNPVVRRTAEEIYSDFLNVNGRVMMAAHRGHWRPAAENSLRSIELAIDINMDIVELDIRKTKDGALVLMHDDTVDRMTDGSGRIADLTLEEIRSLRLRQGGGGPEAPFTDELVPTLHEAMLVAKNRILVNLDKCWPIREDVYRVLVETRTVREGIFKSEEADLDKVENFLNGKAERPAFIQKIQDFRIPAENEAEFEALFHNTVGMEKLKALLSDNVNREAFLQKVPPANVHLLDQVDELSERIQPQAIEINFLFDRSPLARPEILEKLKAHQLRVWVNTMFAWDCGGHTDDVSLSNPEEGWQWHINNGANMILTDRPEQLVQYLTQGSECLISKRR